MVVKDLIVNKDYDYISWRVTSPEGCGEGSIFMGACRSESGNLIPLDGDTYSDSDVVVSYEEFSGETIKNGLVVVVEAQWLTGHEIDIEMAKLRELKKHMTLEEAVVFCEEHECGECPVVLEGIDTRTIEEKLGGKLCCENLVKRA